MRKAVLITLLGIWLFAVFAPPALVLLGGDSETFVSYNLSDEEKQEQEKKDSSEEKLLPNILNGHLTQLFQKKSLSSDNYLLGNSNHLPEIPLPPPEHIG